MTPRAVLEQWISRFNTRDVESLAALYAEDAINYQVALEPVVGREAIKARFARDFATAEMVCVPDAIHEAGDDVALEWRDPKGLRGYWDKLSFLRLHNLPLDT
jgi:ketosteroid isomerase-like protein